ncbi:uncharacterized protein LOC143043486 [Mytilus galloprovincialis]|uniref:uncharacterized protein LOC143043486 n=1 Tax=Mytilus galloprovincialis TaxID=29158 RepID=UPI003F7B924C
MFLLSLSFLLCIVNAVFADVDHCLWQGKRKAPGESWALGCKVHRCGDDGKVNTVINDGCENDNGLCLDLDTHWMDRKECAFFKCTMEESIYVIKQSKGCKVDGECYDQDDLLMPNACSVLKCDLNGIVEVKKLGCDTSEGCKKNKAIWGKIEGESCITEKCVARLVKGKRFISKIESLARSKHCKEKNADVCHRRGTNWHEYDSGEDKCHGIKCGRRGRRQIKRMKACAFEGQCVPFGQSPRDKPGCLCAKGRMVCTKGPI